MNFAHMKLLCEQHDKVLCVWQGERNSTFTWTNKVKSTLSHFFSSKNVLMTSKVMVRSAWVMKLCSLCYQRDSGQVLWHRQHLCWGITWCNDRRSWNGHFQRVSIHIFFPWKFKSRKKPVLINLEIIQSKPSHHFFHKWMEFVILTKLMHNEWRRAKVLEALQMQMRCWSWNLSNANLRRNILR